MKCPNCDHDNPERQRIYEQYKIPAIKNDNIFGTPIHDPEIYRPYAAINKIKQMIRLTFCI